VTPKSVSILPVLLNHTTFRSAVLLPSSGT